MSTTNRHVFRVQSIVSAKWIFIIAPLLGQCAFVCCLEAPTVHLPNQGAIVGMYMKMFRTQNIKAYLGIQYAKAPRFAPPEIKVNKWNMIYNATSYGPKCWQRQKDTRPTDKQTSTIQELLMTSTTGGTSFHDGYDEECLYLNIFIPDG